MTGIQTRKAVALILIVAMAAMGYAAAMARGQSQAGGQVLVLCSGGGLVQVTLDENGRPTGDTHICPDLAFGLLAALEVLPPDVLRPLALSIDAPQPFAAADLHGRAPAAAQARGPPVRI
jgi:hypothetical protein